MHLSMRKNNMWTESMLDALAGDNCDMMHSAGWVSTYLGRYHKDKASTVASKLSLASNHQMDAVISKLCQQTYMPRSALSAASNDTSMPSLTNECLKMTRL
jgi:hypothetical protein